ncbi:MAG TPA: phosphate acyltransferase [Caldisericia bacterium]|jgi:phosphotransacetylase|nr:phosphate acyltransferase [Caldisericia bacterium]
MIKSFQEALEFTKAYDAQKMVVVSAGDEDVLAAIVNASRLKIVTPVLIDSKEKIKQHLPPDVSINDFEIIDEADQVKQCRIALQMINEEKAEILMKGMISTPVLLKEVLNKEYGIRKSKLLSHVGVIKSECYHKMILMTDGGMVTDYSLENKIEILKNAAQVSKALGFYPAKAALISAIETITPNIQSTMDAAIITRMSDRKQLAGIIADGPMAVDNAVSREACEHKGIVSAIAGDVDIMLMPNIESGNIFYKVLIYLGGGKVESAGIVVGAKVPVVVPSRADTPDNKLNAIMIANLMAKAGR